MTVTFLKNITHSGAESLTNQLSGTAVSTAGPQGKVWASLTVSDGDSANTYQLIGRESGNNVVPSGSGAVEGIGEHGRVIFTGTVRANEPLELAVTAAAASTSSIMVKTA